MENINCNCAHMVCPRRGNCKQCIEYHKGKPFKQYCMVSDFKKAQMRVFFNIIDTVEGIRKRIQLGDKTK